VQQKKVAKKDGYHLKNRSFYHHAVHSVNGTKDLKYSKICPPPQKKSIFNNSKNTILNYESKEKRGGGDRAW